jgi:hypothetical protein
MSKTESKELETKIEESKVAVEKTTTEVVLEQIANASTREEKKKLRRAAVENLGPLHLDDHYKKKGFRQRLVNITPGNVHKRQLEGYRLIDASNAQVGNGSLDTAHTTGGALEVEVGRRATAKAVWMEISEEDAQILDEIRDDLAREQADMIHKSDIPENVRVGKVTTEV